MRPVIAVLAAWLLFGGSHLLLSAPSPRAFLSEKLGARNFVLFFTLTAAISLSLLIVAVARYGGDGLPGPNLATVPLARWILGAIALFGAALLSAGIVNYTHSPMAVLARRSRTPIGAESGPLRPGATVERITRHPFFVGLALLMAAHALLASTLAGTIFFSGFTVLVMLGIPMQDRKLLERHPGQYGAYKADSVAVPFTAKRRSHIWLQPDLLTALAAAAILAALHPLWRIGHGATFVAITLIGGLYAVVKQVWRGRKG